MEKESARNQTLAHLHEPRKPVVRLHQMAIKIMKIVELTGLTYLTRWGFTPQKPIKRAYEQNPEAVQAT